MTHILQTDRRHEGGFTLVELAIVLIIVGLLLTGILKGQEMIANAQVTSTIAQTKGLDAALSTFRDKYRALPGDMSDPQVRLANCTQGPCNDPGDANGRIDGNNLGATMNNRSEGTVAFVHMAAADLISGVATEDATLSFGTMLPQASIGGGFGLGYTTNGSAAGVNATLRPGHYLVLHGVAGQPANAANGVLSPSQALQMDNKLDDGQADSGAVQATGTNCHAAGVYATANDTSLCSLYIRVQG